MTIVLFVFFFRKQETYSVSLPHVQTLTKGKTRIIKLIYYISTENIYSKESITNSKLKV